MNDSLLLFDLTEVRQSIAAGVVLRTSPSDLNRALAQGRQIAVVGMRKSEDFAKGHIPGEMNLPPAQWEEAAGLGTDKVVVVYCYHHAWPLGGAACAELAERGYPLVDIKVWGSSEFTVDS
jgi:rhodanese-related sulfurtransferase